MKNVILQYPFNKSYKEHKFKVTGTDLCSTLRKKISNELSQFKDIDYLLILKKYDNYMSFLREDYSFNKIDNENRIRIRLVIPPNEVEVQLPNQSTIKASINLTKSVSENVIELLEYIKKNKNSLFNFQNDNDIIYESFTFFFTPSHTEIESFDDFLSDTLGYITSNSVIKPKIVASSLPLLFQGWLGEKLTLIRRITKNDIIIAEERWKKREKKIQKIKQEFEDIEEKAKTKAKAVAFDKNIKHDQKPFSLKEKSKSIGNFELAKFKNEKNDTDEINEDDNSGSLPNDNFFDYVTEDFFSNCQMAVLNKICVFDLDSWASLACLQFVASRANLKHAQVQILLPFIPDEVQNASMQSDASTSLSNILTEKKRKYAKYERIEAMRSYIQICVEKGKSFCYSEDVKFLLLSKKWRVSSHRTVFVTPDTISIAKDSNSVDFLFQANISNVISVAFDGDFITLAIEVTDENFDSSFRLEKWRLKSRNPQILIYMINEMRSIFAQSSHILSNLLGTSQIKTYKSTDFRYLVSANRRIKSSELSSLLLARKQKSINKLPDQISDNYDVFYPDIDNNSASILNDFNDAEIDDIYLNDYKFAFKNDSDFIEPGISKLICPSKEESKKPCLNLLLKEQSRSLNLVKKLNLPHFQTNSENDIDAHKSWRGFISYSGLENMREIPDFNWLLNSDKFLSLKHKNAKILFFLIIFIILILMLAFFKHM